MLQIELRLQCGQQLYYLFYLFMQELILTSASRPGSLYLGRSAGYKLLIEEFVSRVTLEVDSLYKTTFSCVLSPVSCVLLLLRGHLTCPLSSSISVTLSSHQF